MTETQKRKKPSRTEMRREARSFALQALYQWQIARHPLGEIEVQFRTDHDMRAVDQGLFSELLHGIPGKLSELEAHFGPYLDRSLEELDPIERTVLRIGTFELAYRMEVPYRVVINEAVNLAKTFGATDSHKYVNGVLDKLARKLRLAEIQAR